MSKLEGLYQKYRVNKVEGETDLSADYFVLRLDENGKDPRHAAASKQALALYAILISDHMPELSKDICDRYLKIPFVGSDGFQPSMYIMHIVYEAIEEGNLDKIKKAFRDFVENNNKEKYDSLLLFNGVVRDSLEKGKSIRTLIVNYKKALKELGAPSGADMMSMSRINGMKEVIKEVIKDLETILIS